MGRGKHSYNCSRCVSKFLNAVKIVWHYISHTLSDTVKNVHSQKITQNLSQQLRGDCFHFGFHVYFLLLLLRALPVMLDEEEVTAASRRLVSSVEISLCSVGIDLRSL